MLGEELPADPEYAHEHEPEISNNQISPLPPVKSPLKESRPLSSINDEEFERLIDILGISDIDDEESRLVHAHNSKTVSDRKIVEANLGSDISCGSTPEEDPVRQGQAERSHTTSSRNISNTHSSRPLPPSSPLQDLPVLVDGQPSGPTAVTPIAPRLMGADGSSSPMSPLNLSPVIKARPPPSHLRIRETIDISPGIPESAPSTVTAVLQKGSKVRRRKITSPINKDPLYDVAREGDRPSHTQVTDQFNQALAETKQHVSDLRSRIEQLRPVVKDFVPDRLHARLDRPLIPSNDHPLPGAYLNAVGLSANANVQGREDNLGRHAAQLEIPEEISQMTGDEARSALTNLMSALSLPTSSLSGLLLGNSEILPPLPSVRDVSAVRRALSFVNQTDELVWRRTSYPRASVDIFDEENIQALMDRLQLWERAVRTVR